MQTVKFEIFGSTCDGRVVTSSDQYLIVAGDLYGTHNLVVVSVDTNQAVAHGLHSSLLHARVSLKEKSYRKVLSFLASKNLCLDISID